MKKALLCLLLFIPQLAWADDWLCSEEAAKKTGNTITTCGVGAGMTEAEARAQALDNAKKEFHSLCTEDDCKNHEVALTPLRNECKTLRDDHIQCRRALRYDILDGLKENVAAVSKEESPVDKPPNADGNTSKTDLVEERSDVEAIPVSKTTYAKATISRSADHLIILSTIPMCVKIEIKSAKAKRHVDCNENPKTLLVHQSETELLVTGPRGYKPKQIRLREIGQVDQDNSDSVLEVLLEKI
jgi:hypothetical protein